MGRKAVAVVILLLTALLGSAQAAGPVVVPQQGVTAGWTTYANADRVSVLHAEGNTLWSGSKSGGLVGWDVSDDTFVQLLYPQDRLAGNTLTDIEVAPDGSLWAATTGGVTRYPPDELGQDFTLNNTGRRGAQQTVVQARAVTGEREIRLLDITNRSQAEAAFAPGYLMFGTHKTIYFYRDWDAAAGTVVISPGLHRTVEPGTPVYAVDIGLAADDIRDVATDHAGRVWISTVNGVSVYDQGTWSVYTKPYIPLASNDAGVMAVDGAGRVWISHPERGEFTMFDGTWHTYSIDGAIQSLAVQPGDGNVWAATSRLCDPTGSCRGGGVWAFDGSSWHQRYQVADGIADDDVDSIAFGAEGRIWLGHASSVRNEMLVSAWTGGGWQIHQSVRQVIETDFARVVTTQTVSDLWVVAAGRVWTRHLGAVRGYAPGAGWKALYTGTDILNSNQTRTIATDEAGRIWVGTEPTFDGQNHTGGGMNFWNGDVWRQFTKENSNLPDNRVSAITAGRDGTLWAKTLTGYARFADGSWTSYPGSSVTDVVEDDYWSIIDAQDLPGMNDNRMWTVDNADRVWVWEGEGVRHYRPDTGWVHFTFQNTLRKKEPPVTYLRRRSPRRETRVWISAEDLPDSAAAQSAFANGYLMIGDDPTVYRYESFLSDPQEDVSGIQVSPDLRESYEANTPVYAVELGLLSNFVSDVAVGPDGRMWIACGTDRISSSKIYGGISILDMSSGTWEQYSVPNTSRRGPMVGQVTADVEALQQLVPADFGSRSAADDALGSGFVMFEGDPTLYRYVGYSESEGALTVHPIFNTPKYPTGIQQLLSEGTSIYAVELGLLGTPEGDGWANFLTMDQSGQMWIAVKGVGLSVFGGPDQWTNFRRADDGLASAEIAGMLPRGHEMWIWTDGGGVSVYRDGNWQTYDVFNSGLVDNRVDGLTITLNGEVWMATHAGGISVLTLPGFRLDTTSSAVLAVPGGAAKAYLEIVPVGGFSDTVNLTVDGAPPGVEATLVPETTAEGWVELTFDVSALTVTGSYPLTIVGRSADGLTATRRLTLHVVSSIQHTYLPVVAR